MPGKFSINTVLEPYKPLAWSGETFELDQPLKASNGREHSADCIFLSPQSWKVIYTHIGWGKETATNMVEQGGLLFGRSYRSAETGYVHGIVTHAIPAYNAQGSAAYIRFSHENWKTMMDEFDTITALEEWADIQVIGWYHTHPGRLPVFMSGTDRNTQKIMFSKDWQFAIVLNPQRQTWRAFRGESAAECQGEVIKQFSHARTSVGN